MNFHEYVENNEPNICQIVCFKNGKKTFSDTWNGYRENDAVHVMSVTKSVVALLIGICVDKGLIKSIEDKVLDYFPDYKVKRGEKTIYDVTIRHLMTMKAPYKCKYDPWGKVCSSEDWTTASLDFLGGRKGITGEFKYTTVCLHILTGIIAKVTGKTSVNFANEYLFEPLGIESHKHFLAADENEHKEFTISKTPKEHVWFGDPMGIGAAGYGLCFSAEALAKLGQLCLNKGIYHDKRIVSAEWIEQITTETQKCGKQFDNMSYGLLWWIIDKTEGIYAAMGNSGNVIYINSTNKFVAGITAYFKPTVFDRVSFIRNYLDK